MIANNIKKQFQKDQVEALYWGVPFSIIASVLIAVLIHLLITPELAYLKHAETWAYVIYGISAIRALDAFLYFRADKESGNNQIFLTRFAVSTLLGGVGWGLMLWFYFPVSSADSQFYLIFVAMAIIAHATTSLSYHLGVASIFALILFFPLEVRFLLSDIEMYSFFGYVFPVFMVSQISGAILTYKKHYENVSIQFDYQEKEREYKNLEYAVNQHNIISFSDTEGTITYANDKTLEISGFSSEDLIGSSNRVFNSGEHTSVFWMNMWDTIISGKVWKGKIKNRTKSDGFYWVSRTIIPFMNNKGRPYQYISMSTDITKLVELEEQGVIEKNDALVRAKVAQVLQGQDSLKKRIETSLKLISTELNCELQGNLGVFLMPKGTQQLKIYATYNHAEGTTELAGVCDGMKSLCGEAISSRELVVLDQCHDSEHGHYIMPLMHNTEVLGVFFVYSDLSPSTNSARLDTLKYIGSLFSMAIANEYIKHNLHQSKVRALDMAQAKSDFLANMSHEIRTPMNGVLGMLDLLQDVPLDVQSKNYVETARGSASMLLNVINDILDISKIESGKLHIESIKFDLAKVVEDTSELLAKLAHEKGIELLTHISVDTQVYVEGDMLRLQQVTNNLLSNAIKFTHEGEVSIAVSTVTEKDGDVVLRFEIKDTGIGIPTKTLEKLFQAFTQADTSTSREYGGTGLGLAISKSLIEMMGGEIGVSSVEGKGSTFWFELPFKIIPKEEIGFRSLDKLRILIIDDNKTNCTILESYVKNWGAESLVANEAKVGIEYLVESIEEEQPFDVLLLDMQMPETTGEDVAKSIRSNPKLENLKIILLSSMGLESSMNDDNLYNLMLNKPVRQSQLYDSITSVQNKTVLDNKVIDKKPAIQKLKGNILFVDDSHVNQFVGREFLTKLGLDYTVVSNGKEAFEARKEGNFDLVLMDCQMPVMDGYESTGEIRKFEQENGIDSIRVVALTANAMEGDREKCIAAGMDDYLTKPYTIDELYNTLAPCLKAEEAESEMSLLDSILSESDDETTANNNESENAENSADEMNAQQSNIEGSNAVTETKDNVENEVGKLEGNVLFVDDSKINRYLGTEILTKLGVSFEVAVDGQEALDARKNGSFDLILMDCQMPVMDGYTATREIRSYEKEQDESHITIIALTANAMPGDREKCLESGMDDYLAKPYTSRCLFNILSPYLDAQKELTAV